jgi:DYW family of nucleic acid deaminases
MYFLTLITHKGDILKFLSYTKNKLIELYDYRPDSSCVFQPSMSQAEKLERLWLHRFTFLFQITFDVNLLISEKLAIAWALLTLTPQSNIIMHKNLRVCKDCHEALKLMAKFYTRKFTIRDANRFHHFENGKCSCNDYW